ncbi:MAG: RDD family protein [Thermoplasmatota archaeon]
MEADMEEVYLDFENYPRTESYGIKRAFAYLMDQIIVLLGVVFVALLIPSVDLSDYTTWLMILIVAGIFNWLIKSVMEGMKGESIGKGIMGLKVIDAYGKVTVGESLVRNLFEIVPVILPFFDYLLGMAVAMDSRQKLMDHISKTLVIEDLPIIVEEKPRFVPRRIVEEPKPKEKVMLDYRRIRVGHCPRCDAPYRVLAPGDTSFSGLWNHRCTWCNNLITENLGES